MKLGTALIALGLGFATLPALADEPTPAPAPKTQSKSDPNRIVCRTEEEIGSRLRKRKICMTLGEWRELGARTGQTVDRQTTLVSKPGN